MPSSSRSRSLPLLCFRTGPPPSSLLDHAGHPHSHLQTRVEFDSSGGAASASHHHTWRSADLDARSKCGRSPAPARAWAGPPITSSTQTRSPKRRLPRRGWRRSAPANVLRLALGVLPYRLPRGLCMSLTACRKEAETSCPLLPTDPYRLKGTTLAKLPATS